MEQHKDLEIPLKEIASNTFHKDNYLGGGGFGEVYKGEVSRFKERGLVAFKVLDRKYGQGETEFFKEIEMLSKYKHENIITLLGYCMEGKELILVYEYASHGSLDSCLDSSHLTWTMRLKICLQAAKGLRYLHDPSESHLRVVHRDIKSANILLDDKWNAKVSDFGLSKISPVNTNLVTYATGTTGYSDPQYYKTYTLTEKSDVYSFGVTLFEVLCGRLCYEIIGNNELLVYVRKWKESYQENKLKEIIFKELNIDQIDQSSLKLFSDIAYQCLEKSRIKRPTMVEVVSKLEVALQAQEDYDVIFSIPLPKVYEEIVRVAASRPSYSSIEELQELLSEGVLINGGKAWASVNDKQESCVLISIEECLIQDDPNTSYSDNYLLQKDSRFPVRCYKTHKMNFKLSIKTPLFLSPDVTYGLNLVFHYCDSEKKKVKHVSIRYKFQGETKSSVLQIEDMKEYTRLVAELYQFSNTEECILDFEILLEDCGFSGDLYIECIEFQPLNNLFCLNEKGEHIERIFIESCLSDTSYARYEDDHVNSRFPGGRSYVYTYSLNARVRGQYLTPHISYALNIVFRYENQSYVNTYNPLRYKINGKDETKHFIIYPSTHMTEDGWFIVPFYHFTSQHTTADLQFEFASREFNVTLQVAGFEFQPSNEKVELQVFEQYQHILEAASQDLFYTSLDELKQILSIGIYLNGYKTWFSLNEKGEHCHMISIEYCLIPNEDFSSRYKSYMLPRFPVGLYQTNNKGFTTHVKTWLLSPLITYTVNLILYVYDGCDEAYVGLKYRLRGETTTSSVYLASSRKDDHLLMAELYQFTSDGSIVDLEIMFDDCETNIKVQGILFQPLELVEDPSFQRNIDPAQDDIDTDTNTDTDEEEKSCVMLSARVACSIPEGCFTWRLLPESRFNEVLVITAGDEFGIRREIKPEVMSSDTRYATYMVYKLPEDQSTFESPLYVTTLNEDRPNIKRFVYLVSPPGTPVIKPKFDENSYNPQNRYKPDDLPRQRSDGLMEVKVWEFKTWSARLSLPKRVFMHLRLKHRIKKGLCGLMIYGIEIRPI